MKPRQAIWHRRKFNNLVEYIPVTITREPWSGRVQVMAHFPYGDRRCYVGINKLFTRRDKPLVLDVTEEEPI